MPIDPQPVVLLSLIDVTPRHRDETLSRLMTFVDVTRAEPGCLAFELHVSSTEPCRFMLYEVFADADAFDAHRSNPALGPMKSFLADAGASIANLSHRMLSRWTLKRRAA